MRRSVHLSPGLDSFESIFDLHIAALVGSHIDIGRLATCCVVRVRDVLSIFLERNGTGSKLYLGGRPLGLYVTPGC